MSNTPLDNCQMCVGTSVSIQKLLETNFRRPFLYGGRLVTVINRSISSKTSVTVPRSRCSGYVLHGRIEKRGFRLRVPVACVGRRDLNHDPPRIRYIITSAGPDNAPGRGTLTLYQQKLSYNVRSRVSS